MVIALICMIPVSIIATGFLVLKSVQLGLKWQIQTAEKKEPELKSPIEPIAEAIQQKQAANAENNANQLIAEWLHGESK